MYKRLIIFITAALCLTGARAAVTGSWKNYHAYSDITEIWPAGTRVYVLSSNGLFSYNVSDQSVETYDKMNVLNDCKIDHIAYNKTTRQLLIVYANQNMDILNQNGSVMNLSAYHTSSMMQDKTIYGIDIVGAYAYISTGFGILKVNMADAEISDTYNLGFRVDYCYIKNNTIYAASSTNGVYSASLSANLLDKNNWSWVEGYTPRNIDLTTVYDEQNGCYWTRGDDGSLAAYKTDGGTTTYTVRGIRPDGPAYNYFGFMRFTNNTLFSVGGGYGAVAELLRPASVQSFNGDTWTLFEEGVHEKTGHEYLDLLAIDCDPTNARRVMVSGRTGVYEFIDGKFTQHYNYDNSPLVSAIDGNKNYVLVEGSKFDAAGNFWCVTSQSKGSSLTCLNKSGEWSSHHKSELANANGVSYGGLRDMMLDSRGLLWFVNYHWDKPSFYCYQPSTDAVLAFNNFRNQDGTQLALTYAQCIMEDRSGNIWVGTNIGPVVLYAEDISKGSLATLNQIKVPRNDGTNYADYLLDGVNITCMAIDGGGRKWFGTNNNGVYLISEDNYTQVHHFLTTNSSLLSNNIEGIAINGKTGEVFIATDLGLCSYMSDASDPSDEMAKDNVYAYPNPVRPDYTGIITVTGLSYDSDVKIVTVNGTLVAEGRSNGGMFAWDGRDLNGKRVASGVYMVMAATSEGEKGTVCKIAVVR